jgi:hypothetical protein
MRFAALACLLLCGPSTAQELSINGYSIAVIPQVEGQMFDVNSALREAVRRAGLQVYGSIEEVPADGRSKTLYATGLFPPNVARLLVVVSLYDASTNKRIAVCMRDLSGGAPQLGRSISMASRRIVDDLRYEGFDQSAHEANLQAFASDAAPSPARLSCDGAVDANSPKD